MAKTNGIVKDEEEISKIDVTPNQKNAAAYKRASFHPPDEIWNIFTEAEDCCDIIGYFKVLVKSLNIDSSLHGREFYDTLKSKLTTWKCQSLWDLLNLKLKQAEYEQGNAGKVTQCLIIGAGPIGLRTAIEMLALGCKTVVLDRRTEFTRNNVLHLWPFLLTDFRSLGAKKFYGKFGSGSIDHINIKTLQCILLKVALVLGVEIHVGVTFKHLVEPTDETSGWKASFEPENHILSKYVFNVCIGADGKKNVLPGFPQIELRGALAIGITCNFVNHNTIEEAKVAEISGVSCQFNPNFFKNMEEQYGVKLENIVYYKNETHYFVMTALKASLIKLGVILQDFSDPKSLLDPSNICYEKLVEYTLCAVNYATNHQLPDLEFKKLSNGKSDIALFDFTSIKKAANAARIVERKKQKLLLALVGDSLMEPFWPTGSGCGRGVLSALDVAWTVFQFSKNNPPLMILRDRENVFKLLSGITNDQLQKNYSAFTINPLTRYTAFDAKKIKNLTTLKKLYDTDDIQNADLTVSSPQSPRSPKKIFRKQRSGDVSPTKPSNHVHQNKQLKPKRKSDRAEIKDQAIVGNTKAFWEDHNKKNFEQRAHEQRFKKSKSIEENNDLIEDFEEIESDVLEEASPIKKKGFVSNKSQTLRKHSSSSKLKGKDEPKHKFLKRRSLSKSLKVTTKQVSHSKENENTKQSLISAKPEVPEVSVKEKNPPVESKEQPRYGRFSISVSPFVENKDMILSSPSSTNHLNSASVFKQTFNNNDPGASNINQKLTSTHDKVSHTGKQTLDNNFEKGSTINQASTCTHGSHGSNTNNKQTLDNNYEKDTSFFNQATASTYNMCSYIGKQTVEKRPALHKLSVDTASHRRSVKQNSSFKSKHKRFSSSTRNIKEAKTDIILNNLAQGPAIKRSKYEANALKVSSFVKKSVDIMPDNKLCQIKAIEEDKKIQFKTFSENQNEKFNIESHSSSNEMSKIFVDDQSLFHMKKTSYNPVIPVIVPSIKVTLQDSILVTPQDSVDVHEVDTIDYGFIKSRGAKARKPKQNRLCPMGSKNYLAIPGMITRKKISIQNTNESTLHNEKKSHLARKQSTKRKMVLQK